MKKQKPYNHKDMVKIYKYLREDLFKGSLSLVLTYPVVLIYKRDFKRLMITLELYAKIQNQPAKKEKFREKYFPEFNRIWPDWYMYAIDSLDDLKEPITNGDALFYEHPITKIVFPAPVIDANNYLAFDLRGDAVDYRNFSLVGHGKTSDCETPLTSKEIDYIIENGVFNESFYN